MSANGSDRSVNRLLDIVVEEVSLVDRAANKHRFLIVKRSDPMDETTTDTTTSPAEESAAETSPTAAPAGETPGDGAADPSNETAGEAPLAVAVAALEGLTEAVELLGSIGEEEAGPRLAELAGELRGVSERLAQAAGGTSGEGGDAAAGAADGTDASKPAEDGAGFARVIESVRATLERVDGLLAAGSNLDGADETAGGAEDAQVADEGLTAQIGALVEELRALTGTVKEQQGRLARLEKRSGLPNSAPSGERPAKPDDEDVGWPLDLNRSFDRESVDKAVSFHDL